MGGVVHSPKTRLRYVFDLYHLCRMANSARSATISKPNRLRLVAKTLLPQHHLTIKTQSWTKSISVVVSSKSRLVLMERTAATPFLLSFYLVVIGLL